MERLFFWKCSSYVFSFVEVCGKKRGVGSVNLLSCKWQMVQIHLHSSK